MSVQELLRSWLTIVRPYDFSAEEPMNNSPRNHIRPNCSGVARILF